MSGDLGARLVIHSLPQCGPRRAAWLATHPDGLCGAVAAIRRGDISEIRADRPPGVKPELINSWRDRAAQIDEDSLVELHQQCGFLLGPGEPGWQFSDDPEPPLFLHGRGDSSLLNSAPAVGIVGTRRCTTVGLRVANQLGRELAEAGVAVVSGLARGIDGAAHRGALSAGGLVIGVVASGLDVVYPPENSDLWSQVANRGLLITEAPLGTRSERWRFPARNRIIASLSNFVVVVESHITGGALSTAAEAAQRGVTVGAVPGSVLSPAAAGTNGLLVDGCQPIRHAQDVLDALGFIDTAVPRGFRPQGGLGRMDQIILSELQAGAAHFDVLAAATESSIANVIQAISRLSTKGLITVEGTTAFLPPATLNPPKPTVGL